MWHRLRFVVKKDGRAVLFLFHYGMMTAGTALTQTDNETGG